MRHIYGYTLSAFMAVLSIFCRCFGLTSMFDHIWMEIVQWRRNFISFLWKCKSCTLCSRPSFCEKSFISSEFPCKASCALCWSCFSVWNTFCVFDLDCAGSFTVVKWKKFWLSKPFGLDIATLDWLWLLFTQYKTTGLTAISGECLAALSAKITAFNSKQQHDMRQNAYYRNLKWTTLLLSKKDNSSRIRSKFLPRNDITLQ